MTNLCERDKPILLVFPYDVMAHYLRCLQLANYLKAHFSIRFQYSSRYNSFVTGAGFKTFESASLDADTVQRCVSSFDFSWLNYRDLSYLYNEQVKVIKEQKADAVLGDMAPTLKMAAEKTGVHYFSLVNGYMSRYYSYVRRMPKSYPLYKLFNLLPDSLFSYFTNVGEHLFFHDMHRPFSKIRKSANLSPKHSYIQELEGDVTLLCDLPVLFPQTNLPSNYYFIPPLYHPLGNNECTVVERLDNDKKTLYVSMGSTGNWKKVSFLNNPQYRKFNIVTSGDNDGIIKGPNIFSYSFINSSALFKIIDLVICHGGNGTIYQALAHGIPVLCRTHHLEQDYNVDGLERQHVGKSMDDIKNDNEYPVIIDEWIQKKGNRQLTFIKDKIAEANNQFGQIIERVVNFGLQPHEVS